MESSEDKKASAWPCLQQVSQIKDRVRDKAAVALKEVHSIARTHPVAYSAGASVILCGGVAGGILLPPISAPIAVGVLVGTSGFFMGAAVPERFQKAYEFAKQHPYIYNGAMAACLGGSIVSGIFLPKIGSTAAVGLISGISNVVSGGVTCNQLVTQNQPAPVIGRCVEDALDGSLSSALGSSVTIEYDFADNRIAPGCMQRPPTPVEIAISSPSNAPAPLDSSNQRQKTSCMVRLVNMLPKGVSSMIRS